MSHACTIDALLGRLESGHRLLRGDAGTRVTSIGVDSRTIRPGALFVALAGQEANGLDYLDSARAAGAVAVAVETSCAGAALRLPAGIAVIGCDEPRRFAAEAAAELAGRPSERQTIVAVTGTSGKTTTTYLLEAMFSAAGHRTGVIGTVTYRCAAFSEPAALTTPDPICLQDLLRRMAEAQVTHVALEASSHALAMDRLHATRLAAAIYTNLSRDHLDFHGDLARYAADKAKLFLELLPASGAAGFAALNADDPEVMRLAARLTVPTVTFGQGAEVHAEHVELGMHGMHGTLVLGEERTAFTSALIGTPHLSNILAASAVAWRLGLPTRSIVAGISTCRGVPGRLEPVDEGQPFAVVVDYAHKPDALERSLASMRKLTRGRLIVAFGCGGDRDPGKRPLMGEIAARLADLVVLTSDNPRTEDPQAILAALDGGVRGGGCTWMPEEALGRDTRVHAYTMVADRRRAIALAIDVARPGDLVLIAGKGHEDYQIIGTTKHHLDDREEVRRALANVKHRFAGARRGEAEEIAERSGCASRG